MPADDRPFPSVWARPRRKGRSTLSREQIVAEALRLLDSEGIEALSMRKLAARLDAGATSLYWHVANRDELIELVVDEVYGELDVPGPEDAQDWPAAVRRFAHSIRATGLRHRWLVSVLEHLVSAFPGPNLTEATERMLTLLEAAGFELREAERALSNLSAYILGISLAEVAWRNWAERQGEAAQHWLDDALQIADTTMESHPKVREVVADYRGTDPEKSMDEDFEYGLDLILDGLQARLDRQRER